MTENEAEKRPEPTAGDAIRRGRSACGRAGPSAIGDIAPSRSARTLSGHGCPPSERSGPAGPHPRPNAEHTGPAACAIA